MWTVVGSNPPRAIMRKIIALMLLLTLGCEQPTKIVVVKEQPQVIQKRPFVGITVQTFEDGRKPIIVKVEPNSPAARAGIQEGDWLYKINGKTIETEDDLKSQMSKIEVGVPINFVVSVFGGEQLIKVIPEGK